MLLEADKHRSDIKTRARFGATFFVSLRTACSLFHPLSLVGERPAARAQHPLRGPFVRSLQLDQFKVVADQRKAFDAKVKELQPDVSNRAIAEALGVSHDTINRDAGRHRPVCPENAEEIHEAAGRNPPPGVTDGRRDSKRINDRDTREQRREEKFLSIATGAELKGLFSVIYADPPWEDEFGPNDRQAELHYPVMPLDDIKKLPVKEISTPDAVLYLWALPHMVPSALEVMRAPASGVRQCLGIERRARENAVVSSVKVVLGVSGRDQGELGDHALHGFRWSRRNAHCQLSPSLREIFVSRIRL